MPDNKSSGGQPAQPWSVNEFKSILAKLNAGDITQLQVSRVPEALPNAWVEQFPEEKHQAIEELLFDANAYHLNRREQISDQFGDDVAHGLYLAGAAHKEELETQLKRSLRQMIDVYSENRNKPHREQEVLYQPLFENIKPFLEQLEDELGQCAKSIHALKSRLAKAQAFLADFNHAIRQLEAKVATYEHIRGLFFHIKVVMASNAMVQLKEHLNKLDSKSRVMQVQMDAAREELKFFQDQKRLKRNERERKDQLEMQVAEYIEQMKNYEVIVSENELLNWLDVIVEASINKTASRKGTQAIRTGRLTLFSLLQRYCELQEAAAKQVARNPFSQSDPKKTIQFLMQSEEFILKFFAKKKDSITAWLGGAAEEKIRGLEQMESDLLSEMKQNSKKLQ